MDQETKSVSVESTEIVKKPEFERHSTLKLVFGKCSAWRYANGIYSDVDSIFECPTASRNGKYCGHKFAASPFWRNMSDRFWQYDDFACEYIAAASYLTNAHRFKIWFNPFIFYDFIFRCAVYKDSVSFKSHIEKSGKSKKMTKEEEKSSEKAFYEQREKEWSEIVSGENEKYDEVLNKYGFNHSLYSLLHICKKNKTWDLNAWMAWNQAIVTNPYFSKNLESVMVHEMYHVIWSHLSRVEARDSYQWNLATDFAINQNLEFTPEIARSCITEDNVNFFNRFILSTVKYLMQTDADVAKSLKEDYKITAETDFSEIKEKTIKELYLTYMTEKQSYDHTNKFAHKSADLYYRILLESCVFVNYEDIDGYDGHGKWKDDGKNSTEGVGETIEKDGKTYEKGCSEGTEEVSKNGINRVSGEKERGKGGRQEHPGFDNMDAASCRKEVKATIKDTLERSGINPDDPDEIEKALKAIPGMDILGATVLEWFKIRKKNWKQILKKELTSFSNPTDIDYTMSRESRVIPDFFPGKKRERGLDVIIQIDTSGSINYGDYNSFVQNILEINRSCDTKTIRVMQVHSIIASDEMVKIGRIKNYPIKETGGTTMALGPEKLKREGNKKALIIFTDGYFEAGWEQKDYQFKIIIFLSPGNSHLTTGLEARGFKVINQEDN